MVRRPSVVRPSVVRRSQCSNAFFSETVLPILVKFCIEPLCIGLRKFVRGITPFIKPFLQNRWTDFYETWNVTVASVSPVKCWLWVTHDLCYDKVKFGNLGFSIGKSESSGIFFQKRLQPVICKLVDADNLLS